VAPLLRAVRGHRAVPPAALHARAGQGAEERLKADYESARYSYEDGLDAVRAAERFLGATLEMLEE